jgi:tRNA threonylcarbamoyladenosine biosynthesis protein TsaE
MNSELQLEWLKPEALREVAKSILHWSQDNKVFLFFGSMGVGKTALIKELCLQLHTTDQVTSPSFSVMQVYAGINEVYHWDLYRLHHESELLDLGWTDYILSGRYNFVEWSERLQALLPEQYIKINLSQLGEMRYLRAVCV